MSTVSARELQLALTRILRLTAHIVSLSLTHCSFSFTVPLRHCSYSRRKLSLQIIVTKSDVCSDCCPIGLYIHSGCYSNLGDAKQCNINLWQKRWTVPYISINPFRLVQILYCYYLKNKIICTYGFCALYCEHLYSCAFINVFIQPIMWQQH